LGPFAEATRFVGGKSGYGTPVASVDLLLSPDPFTALT
jgi:hypothetical protein